MNGTKCRNQRLGVGKTGKIKVRKWEKWITEIEYGQRIECLS